VLDTVYSYQYWRLRHRDTIAGLGFRCGSNVQTFEIFGAVSPTEPPTDPGYTPPEPGHASLHSRLTDNLIAFRTRRYADNPLVVQGPGAGPDVTAGGVFADLLRLSAYLGARL